jgi:superfamily II DNA/RNA helicase
MSAISTPLFASLGVPAPVVAALGTTLVLMHPFPIQSLTLIDSLAGRDLRATSARLVEPTKLRSLKVATTSRRRC